VDERLHLQGVGARQFVERALGAVLLRQDLGVAEAAREPRGRHVNGGHLRRQHRLELIPRLDAFDHGQHEIQLALVGLAALRTRIGRLFEKVQAKS
jgi:hypothetical protein